MEFGVFEVLAGLGILFLSLYYYLTSNFDFWKKRHVKGPKPLPFFGNFKDVLFARRNLALVLQNFYEEFKAESLIGIFINSKPVLIVKDPDLIKDVLIKDFHIFNDRGIPVHEKAEPLSQNLVALDYKRWKPLRAKLSPTFTSGKLKDMFYLITECAENFQVYLEKVVERQEPVEVRELTAKFTTDSIGVCAFGLNTNSISDEDSEFRKCGRAFFESSFRNTLRRLIRTTFPRLYDLIGIHLQSRANAFFVRTFQESIDYRRKNNIKRHDFVDLLVDLQDNKDQFSTFEFTDDLMMSQAFVFFVAGFETSSTTMSNTLYELALHQDVQRKLRDEIKAEVEARDGKLTYDSIKSMKYLDQVVKETLRKYPPGSVLQRKASTAYTFNGTKVSIPEGTTVSIPVWAIHRDPELYPDPETYDPERFSEENESKRHPMNYLPFGDGPHNCIGARFANYQTKIGVAAIIQKFNVSACDETCKEYLIEAVAIIPTPIGGLQLRITKV